MHSSQPPEDPEEFLPSPLPTLRPTHQSSGFEDSHREQYSRLASIAELSAPSTSHAYGNLAKGLGDLGASDQQSWGRHRILQPSANSIIENGSGDAAWNGGLWGSTGTIWSTGLNQVAHERRSVDLPTRNGGAVFNRSAQVQDSRRSLDSLSALQAIWQVKVKVSVNPDPTVQAQQHQQGMPDTAHLASLLSRNQQYAESHHDQLHGQHVKGLGVPYLPQQGMQLGSQRGYQQDNGQLPMFPSHTGFDLPHANGSLGNGRIPPQGHFEVHPYRSGQPGHNGLYQNGHGFSSGTSMGLSSSLSATQLQAALQSHPGGMDALGQQLEASALLGPSLHAHRSRRTSEDNLLLVRQAAGEQAGMGNPEIRQPPPPPPRSLRPQLPPPMQTQPTPPISRLNGIAHSKKTTGFTPQRSNAKDRSSLLGSKPKADMDSLNNALEELINSLRPSPEELEKQEKAFLKVSRLLKARWPHAKVHQFGSTANSLSICNNNDIDVCLETIEPEGDPHFKSQLIEEMGDLLMDAGMVNVLPLPKARVPVVKFAVPETGTKVDVSVNNILAIANTKLLRDYVAVDSRLLKLAFIVKHWAKRRQVNDSYRGTLSSYCYVLMCIHHLQTREPPVLPCLQAIQPPTHIRTIGRWNCDYYDKPMESFGSNNSETVADLVWSFFENWAWRHDYNNTVLSVRTGSVLTKAQKDWTRRIGNERHLICIEVRTSPPNYLRCAERHFASLRRRE